MNKIQAINTAEEAYSEFARSVIDFVAGRPWDSASCKSVIYKKMVNTSWFFYKSGKKESKAIGWGDVSIHPSDAALFLRDDLLRTTGQRIWGITFTLFPDGKFNIEYNYNKPEGYEESDEVITGDEINASLAELMKQGKKAD